MDPLSLSKRRVLVAAIVMLCAELAFPPFFRGQVDGVLVGTEFAFILLPPTRGAVIHAAAWIAELVFSIAIAAAFWILAAVNHSSPK